MQGSSGWRCRIGQSAEGVVPIHLTLDLGKEWVRGRGRDKTLPLDDYSAIVNMVVVCLRHLYGGFDRLVSGRATDEEGQDLGLEGRRENGLGP